MLSENVTLVIVHEDSCEVVFWLATGLWSLSSSANDSTLFNNRNGEYLWFGKLKKVINKMPQMLKGTKHWVKVPPVLK